MREQHEQLGAQFGTWFGCALPDHYAELAAEYRAAREGVALFDANYRAFAYLTGPDRVRYLNAVVSNDIKALAPGQGAVALYLNPQGHILAELECYALDDPSSRLAGLGTGRLLLAGHASVHERTLQTLDKYIIMDDCALEDASGRLGSLAVEGPQGPEVVKAVCGLDIGALAPYAHTETTVGSIPCRVIRRSHFGQPGAEFVAEREKLPTLWAVLLDAVRQRAGSPIGYAALNVLRLEAGIPWFGYDFDDSVIPHEAALEHTHISFTKGCYTGQEIVERVRSRGHVNRRRVGLQFSGAEVPAAGTKLLADEEEVGHVTSAARSPALGRAIGMGYVRREHNSPGSRLQWSGGTAEVK